MIPHPWDILVSKLPRLEPKDLEAFYRVIRVTGHPTESELIEHLRHAEDLFRPAFDDERGGDVVNNARGLWRELFGHDLDVRGSIIAPALELRRREYGGESPEVRERLRRLEPPKS